MRRHLQLVVALTLLLSPMASCAALAESLRLQGLRGATTAHANTSEAMRQAVTEMMEELIHRNALEPGRVVSATFTATADLNALFPASIARRQKGWDSVALLDMQQLAVRGDLPRCVRVLVLAWMPEGQAPQHVYQGAAARLRPDRVSRP